MFVAFDVVDFANQIVCDMVGAFTKYIEHIFAVDISVMYQKFCDDHTGWYGAKIDVGVRIFFWDWTRELSDGAFGGSVNTVIGSREAVGTRPFKINNNAVVLQKHLGDN